MAGAATVGGAELTDSDLLAVYDRFCQGFAECDPEQVLGTVADTPELVVVTSETALLRGADELRSFLERFAAGPTIYSWTWDRPRHRQLRDVGLPPGDRH